MDREDIVAMARAAQADERLSDGALYGKLADEIERLRDFIGWIDCWVSNPATSYSPDALDGLFGMTRDKIGSLK